MAHPTPPQRSPQAGNAILAVMIAMLLIMGLVGALIDHFATAEAEAVAESLAKTRIYWAMRGQMDYMLSRARGQPNFSGGTTVAADPNTDLPNDATKIGLLNGYLTELTGINNGPVGGLPVITFNTPVLRWNYPEFGDGTNYMFDINIVGSVRDNTISAVVPLNPVSFDTNAADDSDDGRLYAQFDLRDPVTNATLAATPTPLLTGIENRVASLRVDFCVGNVQVASRTGVPRGVGGSCEIITGDVIAPTDQGISAIERLSLVRP